MSDRPEFTPQERRMIIQKPEEQQEAILEGVSRQERRRIEREREKEERRKKGVGGQMVTVKQMVRFLHIYIENNVRPVVQHQEEQIAALAAAVQYLQSPFYVRWWIDLKAIGGQLRRAPDRLLGWLDSKGIRVMKLVEKGTLEEADDGSQETPLHPDDDRGQPQRAGREGAGAGAPEAGG